MITRQQQQLIHFQTFTMPSIVFLLIAFLCMGGGQSTNVLSNDLKRFESTWVVGNSTQLNIESVSFTTDKVGKGRKASRIKWERKVSLGTTTQYISGERTGKALDNALRQDLYNSSKYRSCDLLELTCLNSTKKQRFLYYY